MKINLPAAVYLRKSRAEQPNDTAKTLEKHRQILCEFAQKNHIEVADVYEEIVSGESLFMRPQMLKLLEKVEKGCYSAVLCVDLDRLGRGGMRDQGVILETFKLSKTKIITLEKTYDLSDESDEELTELKTFISRRELKIINKRLRRGLIQTVKNGGYVSNAPYGYKNVTHNKRPTLEVLGEEAFFVKLIFNMYINEGIGCTLIAQKINEMGAVPRRAQKFGRSGVLGILKNPVYTGAVRYNKTEKLTAVPPKIRERPPEEWILQKNAHPAIIDEQTFKKAAELLGGRGHTPTNTGQIKNPLAGLVYCQKCGRLMQRISTGRAGEQYLACPTKGCVPSVKFLFAQQRLLTALSAVVEIPSAPAQPPPQQAAGEQEKKELVKLIASAQRRLANVYDFYENQTYTSAEFVQRKELLEKEMAALKNRLAAMEKTEKECEKHTAAAEIPQSFIEYYNMLPPAKQNTLLKQHVNKVGYTKQKGSPPEEFEFEIEFKDA